MATGKHTLMLQENPVPQPIDYRDVVRSYVKASDIPDLVIPVIKSVVEMLQEKRFVATALPLRQLEKIDLGDLAAENEIGALRGRTLFQRDSTTKPREGTRGLLLGGRGLARRPFSIASGMLTSPAMTIWSWI